MHFAKTEEQETQQCNFASHLNGYKMWCLTLRKEH